MQVARVDEGQQFLMARCETALYCRPDEQFHPEFSEIKPGQLDVEVIDHFGFRIVLPEFVNVRECFEWAVNEGLAEAGRRFKNIVPKTDDDRQDAKHGDFRPGFAADAHVGAVAHDANMFFGNVQERQAARIAEKREDDLARRIDGLAKNEFHEPFANSRQPPQRAAAFRRKIANAGSQMRSFVKMAQPKMGGNTPRAANQAYPVRPQSLPTNPIRMR